MSKTKTFDIYDEVWVMQYNNPVKKIVFRIQRTSVAFNKKNIVTHYGLIGLNHSELNSSKLDDFSEYSVFKDKQSLMNSVFDL